MSTEASSKRATKTVSEGLTRGRSHRPQWCTWSGQRPPFRLVMVIGVVMALLAAGCGDDSGDDDDGTEEAAEEGHEGHEGMDHGDDVEQVVAREERCDIGFNTAQFNENSKQAEPMAHDDTGGGGHEVDFTLEELAEVFVDPDNPMTGDDETTPEEFVAGVKAHPERESEVLSGGMTHSLAPDNWKPMTDPEECAKLADELERTRKVAEKYPTAQDAIDKGGYVMITPYLPAIASHYINPAYQGEFDLDNPTMLLYDGDGPGANIVGISHFITSDGYPEEGYTGPNDHWHRHVGLCLAPYDGPNELHKGNTLVAGATTLTDEQCADRGGAKIGGDSTYMSHTWIVPGCESDWGLFSGANPAMVFRGADTDNPYAPDRTEPIPPGCGTGLTLEDEVDFDEGGTGPTFR